MWDVAVVGAGPAGAATALGVIAERPDASVLLLDRDDFPRDKVCGDGVAPHALDVLAGVGVTGLLDDWPPVARLRITLQDGPAATAAMARPTQVVPRTVLDARLVAAATARGAVLRRGRVTAVAEDGSGVDLLVDEQGRVEQGQVGRVRARVVVGADGAHSVVRRHLATGTTPVPVPTQQPGTTALAVRGYASVLPDAQDVQLLAFSSRRSRPAYAWSFPIGDGRANVGYGELVPLGGHLTRAHLLEQLEALIPGATAGVQDVSGHPLPLSTGRAARWAAGRLLLVGDAASLVNPVTGEGIYYALLSGVLAGRAAGASLGRPGPGRGPQAGALAGRRYTQAIKEHLAGHLRHTDLAARLVRSDALLHAAVRAAAADGGVFDDLADIGLARGRLTRRVLQGMAGELVRSAVPGAGGRRPPAPAVVPAAGREPLTGSAGP